MKRYQNTSRTLSAIAHILTKTAAINVSSGNLKEFIGLFKHFKWGKEDNLEYIEIILNSLLEMITQRNEEELFVFRGDSGMILESKKILPKEGYCFLGWIRLERPQKFAQEEAKKMCIYKFTGIANKIEVGLYLESNMLHYSVFQII